MEVRIKAVHAVAKWEWAGVKDDDCGICRHPFDDSCPDCTVPGDDCTIVVGKCTHTFHIHCIEKWLNADHKNQTAANNSKDCPLCRQPWDWP